ncbi:MAG: hypothetical protein IJT94_04020 [Oscillibacter sp.]|nr:hypothetical protein [Oscillibacter sp.]
MGTAKNQAGRFTSRFFENLRRASAGTAFAPDTAEKRFRRSHASVTSGRYGVMRSTGTSLFEAELSLVLSLVRGFLRWFKGETSFALCACSQVLSLVESIGLASRPFACSMAG